MHRVEINSSRSPERSFPVIAVCSDAASASANLYRSPQVHWRSRRRLSRTNLIKGRDGNLYVTTGQGGDLNCNIPTGEPVESGCGVVFKLSPMGKETVLYSFPGGVARGNPSGLVRDRNGSLYGTTDSGGNLTCNAPYGCGTVFKVSKTGAEDVLYSFTNIVLSDGSTYSTSPEGGVIRDKEGNFYGTTEFGGTALYCSLSSRGL